jgi:zinc transport system substrate-binding protein
MESTKLIRFCFLALGLLLSCAAYAGERLKVAVSIIPQEKLVQLIAGGLVEVQLMAQPGDSPATYEPNPKQMADLSQADFYYRIGVPFEQIWIQRILSTYPNLPILDARADIRLRAIERSEHEHDHHGHSHEEGELDPHIWLSPPLIKVMAKGLRDKLIEIDPTHSDVYIKNHAKLDKSLDTLDADIRKILSNKKSDKFMVYHPSWGYFADAYGLQQIPIESEGKEPGAKALANLIEKAKQNRISAIFVQKQFSQQQAKAVARAIEGSVVALDPLSEDYPENLRDVAKAMVKGVREKE